MLRVMRCYVPQVAAVGVAVGLPLLLVKQETPLYV